LDIDGGSTFILNYAASDFPPYVCLRCRELDGMFDKNDNPTGIIALYTPVSITSNSNSGIIGYNVIYALTNPSVWDISHINTLTFSLRLGTETTDLDLPLEQVIAL